MTVVDPHQNQNCLLVICQIDIHWITIRLKCQSRKFSIQKTPYELKKDITSNKFEKKKPILALWVCWNQRTNGPVKRSPDILAKQKIKFGSKLPNHFWEKPVLIFKCKWPWAKVKKWPWPSILTYLHYLNLFQVTGCKSSEKSTVFTFSYR